MIFKIIDRYFSIFLMLCVISYASIPFLSERYFVHVVLIIGVVLSLIALFAKTSNEHYYFIVFKPLIFTILILFLLGFLLRFEQVEIIQKNEQYIVIGTLLIIIISLLFYIIKSAFIMMKKSYKRGNDTELHISADILLMLIFLLLPDIIFGLIAFDLIINLDVDNEDIISQWDRVYFSASEHFSLEKSSGAKLISEKITGNPIGQVSILAHAILNKIMELTVLVFAANNILKKYMKGISSDKFNENKRS